MESNPFNLNTDVLRIDSSYTNPRILLTIGKYCSSCVLVGGCTDMRERDRDRQVDRQTDREGEGETG